jgi:vacuolar iron transporter family protein
LMNIKIHSFSMGATAAIVTSMGLIAGLTHGDHSRTSTIAGLLIIAIADNISDSLGIHIAKESEGVAKKEIQASTFGNFTIRFILALTFVVIVWFFPPAIAFMVSTLWGLVLLTILSYFIARIKKSNPVRETIYHLTIAVFVIVGSKFLGNFITRLLEH